MQINISNINKANIAEYDKLDVAISFLKFKLGEKKYNSIIEKISEFNIAIPSWALGTGGTRFGRFPMGGEPSTLIQKIEDVGLLDQLCKSCNSMSLHIPWDIPDNLEVIKAKACEYGLLFDAVNSNTFQDQSNQLLSYKYGSLQNVKYTVRKQAIEHNKQVISYGEALGSKALTVWLADGSSFPGQINFANAFNLVLDSLQEIYQSLPNDWRMLIEYKAFEPNFYSTTIGDWGQSMLLASKLGQKAYTLVDLGHHLPNSNIEQIVALLLNEKKLGGFHFNDSKYSDDDLTAGSIKPYQLFLIFNELVTGLNTNGMDHSSSLNWMIDASHNVKDPLEDLLQSIEAIKLAYAQALLVDIDALINAQQNNDIAECQEILQDAFRTDLRPLLADSRVKRGGVINPIGFYRYYGIREKLIMRRGKNSKYSGL